MRRERELVEQRGSLHGVRLRERLQVVGQRVRIARNIDNRFKLRHQFQGFAVHACTRRVDEDGGKIVIRQADALRGQALEIARAGIGFGKFFGGQTGNGDIVRAVGLNIPLRGGHRGFGNFRGQHAAETARQRQGEVAVAAIEFQQVARRGAGCFFGLGARPFEHFLANARIGLCEAAFQLAVSVGLSADGQRFGNVVFAQHDFLPSAAPDNANAQRILQRAGCFLPFVVQAFVVNQRYQHFAAQRAQKFALVQAVAQNVLLRQSVQQPRHQRVDAFVRRRELRQLDERCGRSLTARLEHGIAHGVALVPNAEFGAHAVTLFGRSEYFDFRRAERGKQCVQALDFGVQLSVVCSGRHGGLRWVKGLIIAKIGYNPIEMTNFHQETE